jgi:ankyrin repeat protein
MNTSGHRPEEIFGQALGIVDAAKRQAFLEQVCGGDSALRQEVESLLTANAAAGAFLRHPGPASPGLGQNSLLNTPLSETAGTRIGRYKLLEPIGEGGFGVVWMAEQEEPVRRRVALKIIKLGMDTREVVARFEAERQALAMMEHANIASVFDGGATETGRPFFVMELVRGVPITEYCDANKLSTAQRLDLFIQVCQAVQHAHQKGIIHRDLKPSNILVTVKDDRPVPKVIDFGIAKATQARLTEKTLFTRFRQWIGTPSYMSPEQAGLGCLDVDTRSDIYSLGVLLYELLTGKTPFDTRKLLEQGYDAVMRTIREEEPPKPSTRLGTLGREELGAVASKRGAEPGKLHRLVHGDLDWIVMKALEKDRARRYETASALARDMEHFLRNEPVSAAAPTPLYRARKFVRRNRPRLAFAALGTIALLLAVAGGKFALKSHSDHRDWLATGTNVVFTASRYGEVDRLRRLLDSNPRLVNEHDAWGATPLAYAALANQTNTLRLLLERGASVNATNRYGASALLEATTRGHVSVVATLLEGGADPNLPDKDGIAPLLAASLSGSTNLGQALLVRGARIDAAHRPSGITSLYWAAMLGHAGFVELLLDHKAPVDVKDANGSTPLHGVGSGYTGANLLQTWFREGRTNEMAMARSNMPSSFLTGGREHGRVVRLLLDHGATLEITNGNGCTPLLNATLNTNREVAQALIERRAKLNARAPDGSTSLNLAALKGQEAIASMLLKAGADPNLADTAGFTPLNTAVEHGQRAVVKLLLEHKANPNLATPTGQTPLHTAAGAGDIESIILLRERGADLHPLTPGGTPLAWAVCGRQNKAVELLIKQGSKADVASSQNNMTALHYAALYGYPELIELLLASGATPDALSSESGTPLHAAALGRRGAEAWLANLFAKVPPGTKHTHPVLGGEDDYAAVVRKLLAAGAKPNALETHYDRPPLFVAVTQGHVTAVDILLEAGAQVQATDRLGRTPLHAVSEMGTPATVVSNVVTLLLKAGANVEARDQDRGTPLHAAVNAGKAVVVALLLEAKARVDAVGPKNMTPLQIAVWLGRRDIVEMLLARKPYLEWRNSKGSTALIQAVQLQSREIISLLLASGADVNTASSDGTTALMVSANSGDLDTFRHLVEHNANVKAVNQQGLTLLHCAAFGGEVAMAKFLLDGDAKLDAGDRDGTTPFILAAKGGKLAMVKFLLKSGADLRRKGLDGLTALHEAADRGHADIVAFLIEQGLSVGLKEDYGATPLFLCSQAEFATADRYVAVARVLLDNGADVNVPAPRKLTPLHRAAYLGHSEMVELLLNADANPDARDEDGKTPLDLAAGPGDSRMTSAQIANRRACAELLRGHRQNQSGGSAIHTTPQNTNSHAQVEPVDDKARAVPGNKLASNAAADRFYFPAGIVAVVNERPILDSEVREKVPQAEELLRRLYTNDAAMFQRKLQEQQQQALEGLVSDELVRIETERVERRVSEEPLGPQATDHRPASLKPLPELRAKTFVRYYGGVAANSVSSQKRVLKIQVKHVGPSSVGDSLVRSRLGVKEGDPVTQAAVDQDIRSLYGTGDFYNIRVTVADSDGGITLTYVIQERPVLDGVQFAGNKTLSGAELLRKLTSKAGERMDERKLFNDAMTIHGLYQNAGFPKASVRYDMAINEKTGRGSVTFEVTEGTK